MTESEQRGGCGPRPAGTTLLSLQEAEQPPWKTPAPSACLLLGSTAQGLLLWQHRSLVWQRLPGHCSDPRHKDAFTGSSHACLLPPPSSTTSCQLLQLLPAAGCAPLPCPRSDLRKCAQGDANRTCPAHGRAEEGQRRVHKQKPLGHGELLALGCFLQLSFEKQS